MFLNHLIIFNFIILFIEVIKIDYEIVPDKRFCDTLFNYIKLIYISIY